MTLETELVDVPGRGISK